jgi:hypothetical protein
MQYTDDCPSYRRSSHNGLHVRVDIALNYGALADMVIAGA